MSLFGGVMPDYRSDQLRYMHRTKEERKENNRAAMRRCYEEKRRKLYAYLLKHPCVDCDEDDPVVLQFDHVRGVKVGEVPRLLASRSWKVVLEEIKKCEVRCANCHLRRHAKVKYKYIRR